ncbi:unnamed protein product [Caretta caretta]
MGLADLLVPLLFLGVAGDPLTIYTLPSSSAVLGSAALLKCRFNIGGPINLTALQVHWYFSDRSVAQYDRGKETFAPGVSISKQELLIGNASLGMENVQVSDEGPYKCVVGYGAERQQSETTLRVFAAPRLSVPRRAAGRDTASAFPCHVRGFYPADVTVAWLRDGRVLTDVTPSAPQRNPDGTFNLTLTYTFTPTASDSGSLFSCRVSHAALAQPLREGFPLAVTGPYSAGETPPEDPAGSRDKTRGEDTVLMANDGVSDAGKGPEQQPLLPAQGQDQSEIQEQEDRARVTDPRAPVLYEISQSDVLAPGKQVTLSCQISRFYPKALSVTWYRQKRGEPVFRCLDTLGTHRIVTPDPTAAPDGKSYSVTSQLRFTPSVPEDDGAEYLCSVEHQTLPEPEGKSTGPLELRAQPQVSEIQVLPHWEPREEVPFAVQMQNFYPREIHRIQWSWDGAGKRERRDPRSQPEPGLLRPPEVSEISQPESVTAGEEITLSCRMAGHFPGVLCVTWLRRNRGAGAAVRILNSAEYRIEPGAPHTQDGKSFQQETRLRFTPSVQRDQGAEYVCRVGHVILRTPVERRSRELQVTGLIFRLEKPATRTGC